MEEIKDLKTSIAIQTVEYEELEIQNDGMKRDIVNLDDKLEEAYLETRNLKADLGKINYEKNKLIEEINSKDVQNACIKDELENSRRKFKHIEKVNVDLQESIEIVENTLESRDQKIYKLEEEIRSMYHVISAKMLKCKIRV